MKKIITSSILVASLSLSALAYDTAKAQTFDAFYSNFTQEACASSKLFIEAEETMQMLRKNEKFTVLDIRTKGEHAVITIGLDNSLYIPIKDLFKKENLEKLPKEKTIVIVCHSGTRATLAAIGLKQIGIKNTRVLKGGLVALAEANNPKNAPL
ncbi:MAG: rhodanese-like domain-containing protein [Campylobacterota bacterium]|nr:rhodanese-like domain-containing protein [Campylobacterota bacterium]